MVDALRLGAGTAQAGLKGVGTDVLRLLVLVGPLARAGASLGRLAQTQMIRLAVTTADVTGPCTFTAVNNAATIAAGRARNLFVLASDAAKALGKPLGEAGKAGSAYKLAAWIDDLVPFLTRHGVRLRNLGRLKSLEEVTQAAASSDGVVVFAIEWTDALNKLHRHSMIAVRPLLGLRVTPAAAIESRAHEPLPSPSRADTAVRRRSTPRSAGTENRPHPSPRAAAWPSWWRSFSSRPRSVAPSENRATHQAMRTWLIVGGIFELVSARSFPADLRQVQSRPPV